MTKTTHRPRGRPLKTRKKKKKCNDREFHTKTSDKTSKNEDNFDVYLNLKYPSFEEMYVFNDSLQYKGDL